MCIRNELTRRNFLRAAGLFTATGIVGATGSPAAAAPGKYYRKISWNYYRQDKDFRTNRDYRPDLDFSQNDRKLVKKAMNVVANRFHRPDILRTTLKNYRKWFVKGIKSTKVKGWNGGNFRRFVETQFAALWERGFPKIRLYPWRPTQVSDNGFAGWGTTAEIVQAWQAPPKQGFSLVPIKHVRGEFKLWLSLPSLRTSNAEQMAGVIAHEMLHNMGHAHNNGYKDNNFITVFGDTLALDGTYADRSKAGGFGLVGGKRLLTPG